MRINSINPYYIKQASCRKTGFYGNIKNSCNAGHFPALQTGQIVNPKTKGVYNRNTSCFFRNDLNWADFGKYLEEKFSDYSKVNTYIWGCSEGQEAYSFAMLADSIEDGSKFYPIKAMDIMPYIISANKTRQKADMYMANFELKRARLAIGTQNVKKSLETLPPLVIGMARVKDEVKNRVEFSCSNIVTDMDKIDTSAPSVIMCRNMWPYINSDIYDECAETMYNKLAKDSIVVIGKFDLDGEYYILGSDNFPDSLTNAGFKPVDKAQGQVKYYKGKRKAILIYEKS